ncbi:MAG: HEPN domain-containing protein [Candidatus Omnitrophica bacterium]|nr:HEPN domain-containing protein [Candidatus Omnitrophota bacterium]
MADNSKYSKEWIEQAEYDLGAAKAMLESGRNIYCVFMCHLCLEKAFKALYVKQLDKNPPKVHSLVYLAQSLKLGLPKEHKEFIENLDEISVPVRYPEELSKVLKEYDKTRMEGILIKAKELLEWLKAKLKKQ